MIIGIAGPTASGKTTIAKMLEEKYDAMRLRYSNILSEIAEERGLDPEDKATLQELFLSEREKQGEDWLTTALEERALKSDKENIIIEGNRRLVDIDTLKDIANKKGDSLSLLFIDASPDVRFSRYNQRLQNHNEPEISREEFEKLEKNGAEDEIDDLKLVFEKEGLLINTDNNNADDVFREVVDWLENR